MHRQAYPFLATDRIRDLARQAAASRRSEPALRASVSVAGHGIGGIGGPGEVLRKIVGRLAAA